jgi:hypothetical protein
MVQSARTFSAQSLVRLARLAWATLVAVFDEFVLADLRAGRIDLSGFPWLSRQIVRLGLFLNFALLLVLLNSDRLRAAFALRPALLPVPGRGQLIPVVLYPLSLFLLGLAWSYALYGAVSAHRLVRAAVLSLYVLTAATWLVALILPAPGAAWLGLGLLLATCLLCMLAARRPLPPGLLFAALFLGAGGLLALVQARLIANDRLVGLPTGESALESNLGVLAALVTPLLMVVGFEIAGFAVRAATWATQAAQRLFPTRATLLLLGAGAGWLVLAAAQTLRADFRARGAAALPACAGAGSLVLALLFLWWVVDRSSGKSGTRDPAALTEAAASGAPRIVLAYVFPVLLSYLPLQLAQIVQTLAIQTGGPLQVVGLGVLAVATLLSDLVQQTLEPWRLLVSAGLLVAALLLLRRGRPALALYLGSAGLYGLWIQFTRDGGPLERFQWQSQDPLVLAWLAVVLISALRAQRRGALNEARAAQFLFLVTLLTLIRQTDFIGEPFSPFLGFAGIGFLAFGLAWDVLTAGGWANGDGRWLPRPGRPFLYAGYMLLTITLVTWAVAAHDLAAVNRYTGEAGLAGFFVLGIPYLYALIPVTLSHRPAVPPHPAHAGRKPLGDGGESW